MGEIELDGVTVTFDGITAVDGVDLRIRDGELLVLVGPSGCGKTTLLRTIAGLERPGAGEVIVDGRRVTDLPARKRDVSLVFQDYALFPHLRVRENVAFDLRMQGADDVERRVREAAETLDIAALLDRSIDELSGGQKQRVALGRAIVTDPAAFLLDEPLANLDAALRERMRSEIKRLQRDLGVTTIHVTHDQAEALTLGDRVAVMLDGRIEQVGTPEAVYRRPASLRVARFVGSPEMNLLEGRYDPDAGAVAVTGTGTADGPHRIPVAPAGDAGDVVVGIRPEDVDLGPRGDGERLDATVRFDEFNGADRFVHLEVPGLPELVARVPAETAVEAGEAVGVRFPPDRVHCFDAATGRRLRTDAPQAVGDADDTDGGDAASEVGPPTGESG